MTRETKIGVVVALSFLLLVGVVVGARMWQGNTPVRRYNAADVILKTQAAPKEDPPGAALIAEVKQPQATPTPLNQSIQQTAGEISDEEQKLIIERLIKAKNQPPEVIPLPRNPFGDVSLPEPPLAFNDDLPPPPPAPMEAAKPKDEKPAPPQTPAKPKEESIPPAPPPPGVDELPPVSAEPASRTTTPVSPPVSPPAAPTKLPEDSFSLPPAGPSTSKDPPSAPLPDSLSKLKDLKPEAPPVSLPTAPPVAPPTSLPAVPPTTPVGPPTSFPTTPPVGPSTSLPTTPPETKIDFPLQPSPPMPVAPPSQPPAGLKPMVSTPVPLPMQVERAPEPQVPPFSPPPVTLPTVKPTEPPPQFVVKPLPQTPPGPPQSQDLPPTKPTTITMPPPPPMNQTTQAPPTPPVGTQPPIASPPIRIPMAPQVRSYDVKDYKVQAGDHSFADISQKAYGTELYGRALLTFNRDYPLTQNYYRDEPPQLTPGQSVALPEIDVLKAKYSSLIGDPGPRPQVNVAANANLQGSVPRPGFSQPTSVTPETPAPPTQPTVGKQWTAADGGRFYRVGSRGESLLEIARQVLGDGRRWAEIYRLNPELQPQFPVPAGTTLKLPNS